MERTLLYYPTIVVRNDQWIRQSILYWDSIGSIVPQGMERKLHQSYDIEILQREGLFRIYQPDDYVQDNQRLASEFETIIEDKYFLSELPKQLPEPRSLVNTGKYMRDWLFEKKMYSRLAEKLIEKSLATREGDRLLMNPRLAMIYMALLAKHMANDDPERIATPATDYPSNVNLIYPDLTVAKHRSPARGDANLTSAMRLSLHHILPVPTEAVQVVDVLRFKSKYKDELINFRNVIYDYQEKIKPVTMGSAEMRELNARFVEKIQLEVKNLGKMLQGDKIQFTLGTLVNIFAVGVPAAVAPMITELPPQLQFPLSIAGATIAGVLSLAKHFVDGSNRQLERLTQNQYSYLYHAQQEGIVFLP